MPPRREYVTANQPVRGDNLVKPSEARSIGMAIVAILFEDMFDGFGRL